MIKKISSMMCLLCVLFQLQIQAQVTTASISGYVSDDKAVLPGATIIAVHEPSGTQYGTTSLENGRFHLSNLRVGGPYKISITFLGYEPAEYKDIWLTLGQDAEIKSAMKATGVTMQEVVVSGKHDPVFYSDHTGAATNISNQNIQRIPSINRSISDMARLTPQSTGNNTYGGRNNLYNNLTINGSLFNNAFGLANMPGGQTNSQPISLDAIDQIQISIAPYDVRQSDFTGAAINAITRSGTNEWSGSVYTYWRNQNYLGKKVEDTKVTTLNFNQVQNGFRIGGPIVKNKLFFFLNGEMERRNEPAHSYVAGRPGLSGDNVSTVQASTLDSLRNFLISKFNYDPGQYEKFNLKTYNDKILVRLDYNISKNHKLNISYNYLKSWKNIVPSSSNSAGSSRYASRNTLWFSNSGYTINNNISSIVGELNSILGSHVSNNLIAGYTSFRDFRSSASSPFPMVDILSNSSTTLTSFGYEQYTPNNKLNTDVFQLSDNVTIYKGAHTITLGGSYERYQFKNGFTPQFYGYFRYNSLRDFYVDAQDGQSVTLNNYQLTYSAIAGEPVPMAEISVAQLGLYAQDEWNIRPNLKVTLGLRVDMPSYPSSLNKNSRLDTLTFLNSDEEPSTLDVSKLPGTTPMWSPRLGFNWDVFGDKTTQIRGGSGIFTGHIPFVWISNQASNNGILFGNINATGTRLYPFNADPARYIPANATVPATVLINGTSDNFKFPQVWRTNIALDQKLPMGIVGTIEGIFTKDINASIHRDYNLIAPTGTLPDGRDTFNVVVNKRRINTNITNAYVLENTDKGYSYFLTAQLQKTFHFGLDMMVAFTYGQTKDLSANPGSIASSAFTGNAVQSNPNKPELSWSTYDQPYKLIAFLTYRKEYLKHFGSSISIIYNGVKGGGGSSNERLSDGRFSYTYGGDLNRDGISGNDLIYIPRDKSEINLIPVDGNDKRTADEIWNQLNAYIEQDEYLKSHRGQIMERNGAITPWNSQIDLKFTQDIFLNVGGRRNTLEFSLDVINLGNLLNSGWGLKKTVNRRQLLNFRDFKGPNGTPQFTFAYFDAANKIPLTNTFANDVSLASRWQLQFGLRYIF